MRPRPRSGSAEADPAYRAGSSRGFCHHMADPGPAASPGVTRAWIRVTNVSIQLSTLHPPLPTAWLHRCCSSKFLKMWTTLSGWKRCSCIRRIMQSCWFCIYQPLNMPCFSADIISFYLDATKNTIAQSGKWSEWSTCGSIHHNTYGTMWEMHFPAVSLFQAVPWHFKYAFTSGFNGPAPIFACLLYPKATKEEREEIERKKVNSFYTSQSCI